MFHIPEGEIAILGDTHFQMRGASLAFYEYFNKFYQDIFFPHLQKNGIKTIIQLGDLFDNKKFVDVQILDKAKKDFFDFMEENGITFITYPGNHDAYHYRNTLEINSIKALLDKYSNIFIAEYPQSIMLGKVQTDIIPWICADNQEEALKFIKKSKSLICFGHFELTGFEMDRGQICNKGMDKELLKKYEMVISGHFHHKNDDGHVYYLGAPGEQTFIDCDDPKGFHIFDPVSRKLEFIQNPNKMFHKFVYNDSKKRLIAPDDYSIFTGKYVKVIIEAKQSPVTFDQVIEWLQEVNPLDITYDDRTVFELGEEEENTTSFDDTPAIIKKYITEMELSLDKEELYNRIFSLYQEAQNKSI